MRVGVATLLALLPSLLLAAWWLAFGTSRAIPGRHVLTAVLLGVAAWAIALAGGIPVNYLTPLIPGEIRVVYRAFVLAALLEEGVKAALVAPVVRRGWHPGVAATGVGVGFALLESAFYIAAPPTAVAFRTLTAVPLHIACTIIAAAGFAATAASFTSPPTGTTASAAAARNARGRSAAAFPAIAAAVLLHGCYNYPIASTKLDAEWALVPLAIAVGTATGLLLRMERSRAVPNS